MKVVDGRADFFNDAKRNGCPVIRPDLWQAIEHLRLVSDEDPSLLRGVDHVEVRVGDRHEDPAEPLIGLSVSGKRADRSDFESADRAIPLTQGLGEHWLVADPTTPNPPTLSYLVDPTSPGGVRVDVPITSFVQVNSMVNQQLVAEVLLHAQASGGDTFLDLYAGAGNFAVALAASGFRGTAVETAGAAIRELERSRFAEVGGIRCVEGDARSVLGQLSPADVVIADPPRSGLQGGYSDIANLTGHTMVLIGCNTRSFATDVAGLCVAGLHLESVVAFDMFPGTDHVETLAVLSSTSC